MILPTAYLAPLSWYQALHHAKDKSEEVVIEVMESFKKQTYRNRCLIRDYQNREITLSIPVKKVEHKQITRDVEISYEQHWQHQHWMALKSAFGKTPYWDYYSDMLFPFYQHPTRWLIDLNEGLHEVIEKLIQNNPTIVTTALPHTTTFHNADIESYWGMGESILVTLMEKGPEISYSLITKKQ